MKRIACFHLLNDYSGSPKVLRNVVEGLLKRGYAVDLHTSRGGVLDTLSHPALRVVHTSYSFSPNALLTTARYSLAQIKIFFKALRYTFKGDTVIYVNTILPAGAALAGRLTGKRVVYHYHENAYVKSGFYRMLTGIMQKLADRIICVSAHQASFLKRREGVEVVPNTLDRAFASRLRPAPESAFGRGEVLMLASLKGYKGTRDFLELARRLPEFRFTLVLNEDEGAVKQWLEGEAADRPGNVTVVARVKDVAPYYNRASVVVNLSNPGEFVETFGLTALEAMACGLPVIVPPVGGIAEMVDDGREGFLVDVRDSGKLTAATRRLLTDRDTYLSCARAALEKASRFDEDSSIDSIAGIIEPD
ncbi:MAG: glycosyltransferase family 4 protein [Muribaculaceae bacterium]|nr:glycosyltransferase family 4 protein [Muribaculaceae bacterium]